MALRKTLAEMRTKVRTNLDEATASFWSATQIDAFINRAMQRVWMEGRKLKDDFFVTSRTSLDGTVTILGESYDTASFQIVAGTREYTLPHDLVEMRAIEVITASYEHVQFFHQDLAEPSFRVLRTIADNAQPFVFFWDVTGERQLVLSHKSDSTLDLRIWYVQLIADLVNATDQCLLPNPLYKAAEEYATAEAMQMDRDANAASWEAKGNQTVLTYMAGAARQSADAEVVRGVFGY